MKSLMKTASFLAIVSLLAPLAMVGAIVQPPVGSEPPPVSGYGPGNLYDIVNNVVNWVFAFIMLLSIMFVIMAAFEFVTGGPEGAKEGRQKLIWAAVGIGFAILARAFPNILRGLIQ
ncbi:MAG: hypothetical protein Q7S63_00935 [bacterium]|nr:hypothetical protein [bacterium]